MMFKRGVRVVGKVKAGAHRPNRFLGSKNRFLGSNSGVVYVEVHTSSTVSIFCTGLPAQSSVMKISVR